LFVCLWHTGLLCKLRLFLPLNYFISLKSYLHGRYFVTKVESEYTEHSSVKAGVPQGSVLGALLYLLYTAELPTSTEYADTTFANDTAELAMDSEETAGTANQPRCNIKMVKEMADKS
jgi:hypothetical protein